MATGKGVDGYRIVTDCNVKCLECGRPLDGYGRSDKKFCCQECKNRFHNRNASLHRNMKARALRALDRNWVILDSLIKQGKTCISLPEAVDAGFNIGFITSVVKVRGVWEYFCYDIRYRRSSGRIYGIYRVE